MTFAIATGCIIFAAVMVWIGWKWHQHNSKIRAYEPIENVEGDQT